MMSRLPSPASLRWWLAPSLIDVFFCAMLVATVVRPGGTQALLADGDTGWHIRTGELVLATGRPPVADPFSFSRNCERWYAWEWLSDVVFALAWRFRGLRAVADIAGGTLCLASAVLFAWLLRRGSGLWIAAGVTLAVANASSVHSLARPHVFSILLYTVSLWTLDSDRLRNSRWIWSLVPICALWANLHAGFVALLATLAVCALVEGSRRYALVTVACACATLLNPYGWQLHAHIVEYLRSSWIMDHVQEFQSPNIRSENMVIFAVMLLVGAALAPRASRFEGALALLWGFAAMRSARHIPFFVVAAAPVIADASAQWWRGRPEMAARTFWETGQDLGRSPRASIWIVVAAIALVAAPGAAEFPRGRFPVDAVERNGQFLAPDGAGAPRILTSDQWADYLIYRLYPRQRVFMDGRSDFYGPALGSEYRDLLRGAEGWRDVMRRHSFDRALLPRTWAISTMLDGEPGWRRVYADEIAVLFARDGADQRPLTMADAVGGIRGVAR
jgi:hypothetical protein